MSLVKVSGNASGTGTLTIAAPNTNSDFTLTLPTGTGTFNISGVVNEVPAGTVSAPSIYPTGDTNTGIFFPAADTIAFTEGGTESMRIDSSGNLLVGTTSVLNAARISVQNSANVITAKTTGTTNNWTAFVGARDGNDGLVAAWYQNLSGSIVGTIGVTASATTYNTSSDYRLKNTISPMTGALAKVALLKPVTYKWNIDGSSSQGFIAHELQDVVPDCVTGEKDAVETYIDEDGNEQTRPKYQGVDTSFLVATLTAAIQEQQALIQSLTDRITALENK